MLQAAATDLTKVIMDSVKEMVDAEIKRALATSAYTRPAALKNEVTVVLWSSEVGAYMDKDPWQSRNQVLAKVWKRTDERNFRDVRDKWILRGKKPIHVTSKQVIQEALKNTAISETYLSKRTTVQQNDPYLKIQTVDDVEKFKQTHSTKDVVKLYRTKGKLLEEETSTLFSDKIGQPVSLRNTSVAWEPSGDTTGIRIEPSVRPLGPILNPGPYILTGEMDACLTQPPFQNTPVEFKMRMTGIPSSIPHRDILQIHTYMAMMGSRRGFLVQRAFGTMDVDTTTVEWDEELWKGVILPAIESTVCDVRRLLRGSLADEDLRHQVLLASESSTSSPSIKIRPPTSMTVTTIEQPGSVVVTTKPIRKRKLVDPLPDIQKYNLRHRPTPPSTRRTV